MAYSWSEGFNIVFHPAAFCGETKPTQMVILRNMSSCRKIVERAGVVLTCKPIAIDIGKRI